jgi:uncharacterized membrane protein YjjP (DUF1212 family)
MAELFATGRIVDLIIALVVVEAALLTVLHRNRRRGPDVASVVAMLVPGVFLLLALRAALTAAPWTTIALWLIAALVAHLADVARRLR